jgi:hypothetical protein
VNLTRWEIYYAVYLATLDSGDAICANWRGTLALPMCGSGRGAVPFGIASQGLCHVRGFYLSIARGASSSNVYFSTTQGPRCRAESA